MVILNYSIIISEDGKYLHIVVKADVTIEIARQWTSGLVELSRSDGIKKYLFDSRAAKNISNVTDNYNFSYDDVSQLNLDRASRQEILVDPEYHSHDFIETTKVNAGYNVKIFTDKSEAIEWPGEE